MTDSKKPRNVKDHTGESCNGWVAIERHYRRKEGAPKGRYDYTLQCLKCGHTRLAPWSKQSLNSLCIICSLPESRSKDYTGAEAHGWVASNRTYSDIKGAYTYTLTCTTCGHTKTSKWEKAELRKKCSRCRSSIAKLDVGHTVAHWRAVEKPATSSKWQCLRCNNVYVMASFNILRGGSKSCLKCSTPHGGLSMSKSGKSIRPYYIWTRLRREDRLSPEWADNFPAFLEEYLQVLGQDLPYFQRHKVPWSHHQVQRKNPELPYGPGNLQIVPFFTERAYHRPTYRYWRLLSRQGILAQELVESYSQFLLAFGLKKYGYALQRKKLSEPHSKDNSCWILKRSKKPTPQTLLEDLP